MSSMNTDPRRKFLAERSGDRCPFCGTETDGFPVCKGCDAEKIWSNSLKNRHLLFDTIYFLILIPLLLYFKSFLIGICELFLGQYGKVPYYLFLAFCCLGLAFLIYDWAFNNKSFYGFGWKKRRK